MDLTWLLASFYAVGRRSSDTFNRKRSLLSHLIGLTKSALSGTKKILLMNQVPWKRRMYYALSNVLLEYGALVEYVSKKIEKGIG